MVVTSTQSSSKSSRAGRAYEADLFRTGCPIGYAGGDTNLYRYVGNSPVNATDPSGLRIALTSDAQRNRLIAQAVKELEQCNLPADELQLREAIVKRALRKRAVGLHVRKDPPETWPADISKAIQTQYISGGSGCKVAVEYILLGALEDVFRAAGDDILQRFHHLLRSKKRGKFFETKCSSELVRYSEPQNGKGFTAADLKPGDWVWANNPHWGRGSASNAGSNAIYIGNGQVVTWNGTVVYTIGEFLRHVSGYGGSIRNPANPAGLQRLRQPLVPDLSNF